MQNVLKNSQIFYGKRLYSVDMWYTQIETSVYIFLFLFIFCFYFKKKFHSYFLTKFGMNVKDIEYDYMVIGLAL